MKRKILVSILLIAALIAPPQARADVGSAFVILNAVAAAGASSEIDVSKVSAMRAQVYSAAGSTATVLLQCRSSASAPWFTVATITDPSTTGEYWSIPLAMRFRANVSVYVAGNITVVLETHTIGK